MGECSAETQLHYNVSGLNLSPPVAHSFYLSSTRETCKYGAATLSSYIPQHSMYYNLTAPSVYRSPNPDLPPDGSSSQRQRWVCSRCNLMLEPCMVSCTAHTVPVPPPTHPCFSSYKHLYSRESKRESDLGWCLMRQLRYLISSDYFGFCHEVTIALPGQP